MRVLRWPKRAATADRLATTGRGRRRCCGARAIGLGAGVAHAVADHAVAPETLRQAAFDSRLVVAGERRVTIVDAVDRVAMGPVVHRVRVLAAGGDGGGIGAGLTGGRRR